MPDQEPCPHCGALVELPGTVSDFPCPACGALLELEIESDAAAAPPGVDTHSDAIPQPNTNSDTIPPVSTHSDALQTNTGKRKRHGPPAIIKDVANIKIATPVEVDSVTGLVTEGWAGRGQRRPTGRENTPPPGPNVRILGSTHEFKLENDAPPAPALPTDSARLSEADARRSAGDEAQRLAAEARAKAEADLLQLREEMERRAAEQARQVGEEARRQVEEEVRQLTEETRRAAAETRQRAEAEAQSIAEEARREAAELRQQQARELALQKAKGEALEQARHRALELVRERAKDEARKRLLAEAKRKAMEEARRRDQEAYIKEYEESLRRELDDEMQRLEKQLTIQTNSGRIPREGVSVAAKTHSPAPVTPPAAAKGDHAQPGATAGPRKPAVVALATGSRRLKFKGLPPGTKGQAGAKAKDTGAARTTDAKAQSQLASPTPATKTAVDHDASPPVRAPGTADTKDAAGEKQAADGERAAASRPITQPSPPARPKREPGTQEGSA